MKILINYSQAEVAYLPVLQYYVKAAGYAAVATTSVLTISELVTKAKNSGCQGIFLCNEGTLRNLVPAKGAT